MRPLDLGLIALCVVGISVGQLLFKLSTNSVPAGMGLGEWLTFAFNRYFLLALIVYGVSSLFWVLALRRVELVVAYPFMGLAFVIVPLASHFLLDEHITGNTLAGAFLIFLGLVVSIR